MNNQTIKELNYRKLDKCYFCIYPIPVTIYISNSNGVINPKTLLIFYGCNINGKRKYITSVISDNFEKVSDWYDFFIKLKSRDINTILYGLTPNIINLRKAIKIAFPEIILFNSHIDTFNKISKYFTINYTSNIFEYIRKIYVSKDIEEYNIMLSAFKDEFSNSPFLLDILDKEFNAVKSNYSYPYELRKHIYSYYFIRDFSKKLLVISHSKSSFSSIDEFIEECIEIIKTTEKRVYCPKSEWVNIINILYSSKKELIKQYL